MEAIIKNIVGDMIANMENECVKVCQSYGFDVDKERLTQALTDARKFYDEGFRDGKAAARAEIVRCKDCKHWKKDCPGCTDFVGRCGLANYMVGATGYCVYGERRSDDAV